MNRRIYPNESNCEKLRDELFDTKVDLKSFIRSIKIIVTSVSIIITILAFFGYNKIENIQTQILEQANERVAKVDTLLAKVDENRINIMNAKILATQKNLDSLYNNIGKLIIKNKKLEDMAINTLPPNEQIELSIPQWFENNGDNDFEIRMKTNTNNKKDLFVIFNDNFDLNKVKCLAVEVSNVLSKNTCLFFNCYKIQGRINKLSFQQNFAVGSYKLQVGYFTVQNGKYSFYKSVRILDVLK
jgi:hypothetical protein